MVVRSNSRSVAVDNVMAMEMTSLDGQARSTSFPEDFISANHTSTTAAVSNDGVTKPLFVPASHSKEFRSVNGGAAGSSESSTNSLNTQL